MGKKKKKKKSSKSAKKKTQDAASNSVGKESTLDAALKSAKKEKAESISLDSALKSAKKTQTDLQGLLRGVSEGDGYYVSESKEEKMIEPQLNYEAKSKIAEAYLMEDIPLTERIETKTRKKSKATEVVKSQVKEELEEPSKRISEVHLKVPPQELLEKKPLEPSTVVFSRENIYLNLQTFFEEYLKDYNQRYDEWEASTSHIIAILRKMRKTTMQNTESLVDSLNILAERFHGSINLFQVKRKEIEKVTGMNLQELTENFQKILGIVVLKVKEYELKRLTDELIL